ncbi:MAG: hypothetical protein M3P24_11715 [Gemmatimonadota bacterium]|nr:hypothetical protein [Gemmatimonadota bacterium]
MRMLRRVIFHALPALLLAAPAAAQEGGRVIARDGQRVEVQISDHGGAATSVCLESAEGVAGRKRLEVSAGEESTRLTTAGGSHGPHCAFFQGDGTDIRVRLEYFRFVLLAVLLAEMEYSREEGRGKTITFRWVKE